MQRKSTVFAFVLELKKTLFRKHTSDQDLDAIRIVSDAPNANLHVIYPGEWKPPKVNSFSAEELKGKNQEFTLQVLIWFANHMIFLNPAALDRKTVLLSKDSNRAFVILTLD